MSDKIIKYDDTVVYENGAWVDSAYQDIAITGGDDATNSDLIAFLTANAVQNTAPSFTRTKAAIKIYEDLTQEEYDALTKEPHSFYLVNGVGIYKGTTLISAGALVSGANIKTINGESVLGSGNLTIEGGSGSGATIIEKETTTNTETNMPNFDTLTFTTEELTQMQEDNVVLKITLTDTSGAMYLNKIMDYGAEPYLYHTFSYVAGGQETVLMIVDNEGSAIINSTITPLGGGAEQEMIVIDYWYNIDPETEEITIAMPEEYRDFERLKNAILVNFGRLLKVAEISEDEIVFREVRYFPDGASGSIDVFDLAINLNDWSIGSGFSGSVPHMIGNDTSGYFSEIHTAKNPLRTLTLTPFENAQVQPYGVAITDVPNTATNGTLTQDQLEILQASDSNYLMFNNEKYYLNDKEHTEGYLTYSHVGVVSDTVIVKTITITVSTRGWVLIEKVVGEGAGISVSVEDDNTLVFTNINAALTEGY